MKNYVLPDPQSVRAIKGEIEDLQKEKETFANLAQKNQQNAARAMAELTQLQKKLDGESGNTSGLGSSTGSGSSVGLQAGSGNRVVTGNTTIVTDGNVTLVSQSLKSRGND